MTRPEIVTLCGSTRFREQFEEAGERLTLAGVIVLSCGVWDAGERHRDALATLHRRKIDLSDGILVIDVDGYVGESTRGEIAYARETGKTVRYLSDAPWPGEDPDVALVLAGYTAYARGDVDAAVAGLAEDVEWVEPDAFPNGGVHRGRAAVAAYLRASLDGWVELRSEPEAYRSGAAVVVVHRVSGRTVDGRQPSMAVADVHTVRDGQVVAMHAYADPDDARARYPADPSR